MSTLTRLKEIASRATPGPWRWDREGREVGDGYSTLLDLNGAAIVISCDGCSVVEDGPSAEHIAAFNPEQCLKLLQALEYAIRGLELYSYDKNWGIKAAGALAAIQTLLEGKK